MVAKITDFSAYKGGLASASYKDVMPKECAKLGMKPVCDHPSYCRNSPKSIFIGGKSHLSYPPYRSPSYTPCGFEDARSRLDGLCFYRGDSSSYAMCQNGNSYTSRTLQQANPGFLCAKRNNVAQGDGHGAVTNWKQSKCEKGFYCAKGARIPCNVCPKEEYGKQACTTTQVSDLPCNVRREGGQSLVIGGPFLVILEGNACNPL